MNPAENLIEPKNYTFYTTEKEVKQFDIWKVEWKNNPKNIQLAVIVQTNYLNMAYHASFVVCPIVDLCMFRFWLLRIIVPIKNHGYREIVLDQVCTISGQALVERVDILSNADRQKLRRNLCIIMGFTI